MAERLPQNYANHRRYDPPYHVFLFGVIVVSFVVAVWRLVKDPRFLTAWAVVFMAAMVVLVLRARGYALKVQDRVIVLEERLRLASLLPEPLRGRIAELSPRQLVGLRFAPDAEVLGLVEAALKENLSGEDIKKRIKDWRPDTFRV